MSVQTTPTQGERADGFDKLVDVNTRITEALQLEASFSYRLSTKDYHPKKFQVETYFFIPKQFNLSESTYPISKFYRDIKSYINFRLPKLSFKELLGEAKNNENSPVQRMHNFLSTPPHKIARQECDYLIYECRIWASAFYIYTERKARKLMRMSKQRLKQHNEQNDLLFEEYAEDCMNRLRALIKKWAELNTSLRTHLDEQACHELLGVEEYVFITAKDFLMQMLNAVNVKSPRSYRKSQQIRQVKALLRLSRILAIRNDYPWVDTSSSAEDVDNYMIRRSYLKKKIWSSLYLATRIRPVFKIRQQLGAMIAAGFAGAWAVLAELMLGRRGEYELPSINSSGFIILTAFVIAYVLKDRIKEIGRSRFKKGIFGRLPDSSSKIYYKSSPLGKDLVLGVYSELSYYGKTDNLPDDIASKVDEINGMKESYRRFIYYRKDLKIRSRLVSALNLRVRALYDFFRINLSPLLYYVDAAESESLMLTKDFKLAKTLVPKAYQVDMILKISGKSKPHLEPYYEHFRLTLSKKQIHRVSRLDHPSDQLGRTA